ncbi:MAG: hydrogenase maturation protease [Nitrososphaerales archaeon]|jgi:hydrogenase maturation protease
MVDSPAELEPEIWDVPLEGKQVVVGLGNRYMTDDGIGIRVAEELRGRELGGRVLVFEYQTLELSLLWQLRGASRIVVVDALRSGGSAGTVSTYSITPREGPLLELPSPHAIQLHDTFDLANLSGMLPCPVTLIGVEPSSCDPGEGLTQAVSAAIQPAVDAVVQALEIGP